MSSTNDFHDPVLKEAVRRCWGGDCASAELRAKIAGLLKDDDRMVIAPAISNRTTVNAGSARRTPWMISPRLMWPIAAAAVLVVSVVVFNRNRAGPIDTSSGPNPLPIGLEAALITTHDGCCNVSNHQGVSAPKDDDNLIASAMRDTLHRPVLMVHPGEAGWNFHGAAFCPVDGVTSGHLVFGRGDQRLSVFSLPKSMFPSAAEGSQFAGTYKDHCIVGFVKDGALFCAVETGPAGTISLTHLQELSKEMEPAVAVSQGHIPGGELAELLRPVNP